MVTEFETLKIGQVAFNSGLPVKTIRYYGDLGLLSPHLSRNASGYRLFTPSVINRLNFIRRAQSLGLNLKQIKEILTVHDEGKIPCGMIKQLLVDKLENIKHQIEELNILQIELKGILSGWQDFSSPESLKKSICPNIINH
ncbi:MAG: heavy metal-responsive transcriptional regulator [Cyanobacteria bacterium]|nr:heavy metal-responsive transcriptional regulator [Cyanobacteria bacterium CG_2015-16_32_12]NCO76755.1 heavy metal-responsive transcriptional regulator [Cyanobacteria bacterium CG_2015-22_32_23]NCQ04401.1 heavy metal-responsive transcriptional regulator [Cyanobacteria bacterium CG_2015-09_32_10]NCQ40804.1 heavy metal-responsive transcriptional regulator [Cyanobacteria bacterium CG_2015-04_32_10]NCS84866.1 heavy metal-responsive transcriptional regulator [Cyanobacteria bacterium CG_2015-02_32_